MASLPLLTVFSLFVLKLSFEESLALRTGMSEFSNPLTPMAQGLGQATVGKALVFQE
jgi:hypothetical protein